MQYTRSLDLPKSNVSSAVKADLASERKRPRPAPSALPPARVLSESRSNLVAESAQGPQPVPVFPQPPQNLPAAPARPPPRPQPPENMRGPVPVPLRSHQADLSRFFTVCGWIKRRRTCLIGVTRLPTQKTDQGIKPVRTQLEAPDLTDVRIPRGPITRAWARRIEPLTTHSQTPALLCNVADLLAFDIGRDLGLGIGEVRLQGIYLDPPWRARRVAGDVMSVRDVAAVLHRALRYMKAGLVFIWIDKSVQSDVVAVFEGMTPGPVNDFSFDLRGRFGDRGVFAYLALDLTEPKPDEVYETIETLLHGALAETPSGLLELWAPKGGHTGWISVHQRVATFVPKPNPIPASRDATRPSADVSTRSRWWVPPPRPGTVLARSAVPRPLASHPPPARVPPPARAPPPALPPPPARFPPPALPPPPARFPAPALPPPPARIPAPALQPPTAVVHAAALPPPTSLPPPPVLAPPPRLPQEECADEELDWMVGDEEWGAIEAAMDEAEAVGLRGDAASRGEELDCEMRSRPSPFVSVDSIGETARLFLLKPAPRSEGSSYFCAPTNDDDVSAPRTLVERTPKPPRSTREANVRGRVDPSRSESLLPAPRKTPLTPSATDHPISSPIPARPRCAFMTAESIGAEVVLVAEVGRVPSSSWFEYIF
ncbi:hypothetical protein BDK51DRAFT_49126 [Blyttiomyces helicus]|uniref:Uncharacterized protein n=1 Tax=Blyttiomyces helicus TaxID=388810 RepID=A0A4P9W4M7_9FUNG|nr:hypothetical protein BDK51DRAFT_49126 [Blyttiomyces helicus]|eukprot:RKO86862.1 hypothetical protein BDK51DRAFT_49126 [Blyttiomyces helicus]